MNLAELFIAIGIKAEGVEQLVALNDKLKDITKSAKEAIKELTELNGIKIAPTVSGEAQANPEGYDTPIGPHQPITPNPSGYDTPIGPKTAPIVANPSAYSNPIGPEIPASVFIKQAKDKLTAIKQLSEGLNKLAVMLGAVAAATAVLIAKSVTATMEMANFGKATDMSTAKLQAFQHAAQVGGASGAEMAGMLDSLQSKLTEIKVGEGDISPFAMLGLDVSKDPMKMMDDLRAKLAGMSGEQKQFARLLAGRIGINSAMFASLLRQSRDLSKSLVLEQDAIDSTSEFNAAWQDLLFSLSAVRNQIVSALAPSFTFLANILKGVVVAVSKFTHWLASANPLARLLAGALGFLVAGLFGVSAAMAFMAAKTALTAAMMVVGSTAAGTLAASIWGVVTAAAAAAAPFLLIAGIIAALAMAVDEIIVTFQGGKSVIGSLGESLGELANSFLAVIDPIGTLGNAFFAVFDFIPNMIDGIVSALDKIPSWLMSWLGGGGGVSVNPMQSITQAAAQPPSNQPNAGKSSNVSQDIEINVDGSKDPRETAKAVNNGLKAAIGNAYYSSPAVAV